MIYKSFNKRVGNLSSTSSISINTLPLTTPHPQECITRQIISLNESAVMIGSGGGRRGAALQGGGILLLRHSPVP